ncbi:MAG: class I SAM-dependent methyltransferase, partial [Bacteroides sp.]
MKTINQSFIHENLMGPNRERFDAFDCGSRIKAIQADAPDLPFEQHYFDALFSLDSYNYFGCGLGIIDKIANFVKSGGIILLSVPGLVCELNDDMMKILGRS